jgi:hypothetical protein
MRRFNVKFYGRLFDLSQQMVGLQSEDCFPLATYKIFLALQQQDKEHSPYVFAMPASFGSLTPQQRRNCLTDVIHVDHDMNLFEISWSMSIRVTLRRLGFGGDGLIRRLCSNIKHPPTKCVSNFD